ncbi:hypothetical protein BGZ94_000513 [Podila epigama]|nr:hypothetical protein BGZ94_000513 [Podila epigama]
MLSSHHGKTPSNAAQASPSYYGSGGSNKFTHMHDEPMDTAMDLTFDNLGLPQPASNNSSRNTQGSTKQQPQQPKGVVRKSSKLFDSIATPDLTFSSSPVQSPSLQANMSVCTSTTSTTPNKRSQLKDLFIITDISLGNGSNGTQELGNSNNSLTTPVSTAFHNLSLASPSSPFMHHPSPSSAHPYAFHPHQSSQQHRSRSTGTDASHHDCVQCNTPPANCKIPNLSRRSSLAQVISPPTSAGLVKSATSNAILSSTEQQHLLNGSGDCSKPPGNSTDSPKNPSQRRTSTSGAMRRQHPANSSNNNDNINTNNNNGTNGVRNTNPSSNGQARMSISMTGSNSMFNISSTILDTSSSLPTPTDSIFRGDLATFSSDLSMLNATSMAATSAQLPPTPTDPYFSTGLHPFDALPSTSTPLGGSGVAQLPISTDTKAATIQYLQQLQQSMMFPDLSFAFHDQQQQGSPFPIDLLQQQQQQQRLQKGLGQAQPRRGSKKVKRRASAFALGAQATSSSLPPSSLPWNATASDDFYLLSQQQHQSSSSLPPVATNSLQQAQQQPQQKQQPQDSASKPHHGPAPCGNPDPLYEYLASPTVVPGLEIIGQDYYGNYVQILPICPETSCSMNQDPVYLNLLQAIYAHTIPFLDLAPGSQEESQRLFNGTPSAIATQSIQPPFKHLLPLSGQAPLESSRNGRHHSLVSSTTHVNINNKARSGSYDESSISAGPLTLSMSSPSIYQGGVGPSTGASSSASASGSSQKLHRRASLTSISSAPNSRRSSVISIASNNNHSILSSNNPARMKKNLPRTHPYKSTSSFSEDNTMVTEAILTQVGGVGSIGNSANNASVTDPRRKVAESMVHMDEAEYAAHYSKHQQSIQKSASNSSLRLAQTLATSLVRSSTGTIDPCSLMASSISASSTATATATVTTSTTVGGGMASASDSIAAADFIRALSECNGGMGDLGLSTEAKAFKNGMNNNINNSNRSNSCNNGLISDNNNINKNINNNNSEIINNRTDDRSHTGLSLAEQQELVTLENLMMMDSTTAAAVQAAASATVWPNWFDLNQLEQDVCDSASAAPREFEGLRASSLSLAVPAASSSSLSSGMAPANTMDTTASMDTQSGGAMPLSTSSHSLASFGADAGQHQTTQLLLSSSTNLAMLDDTCTSLDQNAGSSSNTAVTDNGDGRTLASSSVNHANSTSQILVFDQHQQKKPTTTQDDGDEAMELAMSPSASSTMMHSPATQSSPMVSQGESTLTSSSSSINDLALPYSSSLLTVLPFSAQHSHPIFPTRGSRRSGWYRSKSVASQGLSEITGVDYTTTCWYDVEQLQTVVRDSISFQEALKSSKSLEDLTEPTVADSTTPTTSSTPPSSPSSSTTLPEQILLSP